MAAAPAVSSGRLCPREPISEREVMRPTATGAPIRGRISNRSPLHPTVPEMIAQTLAMRRGSAFSVIMGADARQVAL